MSSIQENLNIKAETIGLTAQDALNKIVATTNLTMYEICKGILAADGKTYDQNVSIQDMLNDLLGTDNLSFQETSYIISLIPNE